MLRLVSRLGCLGLVGVAALGLSANASVASPAGAGVDRLVKVALLSASDAQGVLPTDGVAVSGRMIVAHTDRSPYISETGVFVWVEPTGGWSSSAAPAARLVTSTGVLLGPVAIWGRYVFAEAAGIPGEAQTGTVYVFARPAGGWSGTVHESAVLTPSPPGGLGAASDVSLAASGRSVVASNGGAEYVYNEPTGGWAGSVRYSAKLTAADGASLGQVGFSGRTIAAGARGDGGYGAVYVFREPTAGWAGALQPSAMLLGSHDVFFLGGSVALSGSTIVAGGFNASDSADYHQALEVFSQPRGGWGGIVRSRAERTIATSYDTTFGPGVAVSGPTIAALFTQPGIAHVCPCDGTVYAETPVSGSASGTSNVAVNNYPIGTGLGAGQIALSGSTLVVAGTSGVQVYSTIPQPTLRHLSLNGLAREKPRLQVQLATASISPIASIRLTAPPGLRFARKLGVAVVGAAGYSITIMHGRLALSLRHPATRLKIKIGPGALIESAALAGELKTIARFNRTHKHKHALRLTLTIHLKDSTGHSTSLTATTTAH